MVPKQIHHGNSAPSARTGNQSQCEEEGAAETWASATAICVAGVRKRIAIARVTVQPTNTNHGQEMCGHHSDMNHPKFQEAATNLPCNKARKSNAGIETLHNTSTDMMPMIIPTTFVPSRPRVRVSIPRRNTPTSAP